MLLFGGSTFDNRCITSLLLLILFILFLVSVSLSFYFINGIDSIGSVLVVVCFPIGISNFMIERSINEDQNNLSADIIVEHVLNFSVAATAIVAAMARCYAYYVDFVVSIGFCFFVFVDGRIEKSFVRIMIT